MKKRSDFSVRKSPNVRVEAIKKFGLNGLCQPSNANRPLASFQMLFLLTGFLSESNLSGNKEEKKKRKKSSRLYRLLSKAALT